jgi:hypothetical protein
MIELRMPEWVRTLLIVLFAAVILFFCMAGCKVQAPIARTDTIKTTLIKEVIKDTTIYITDSAGFRAALECDSLGQVRIRQIQDYYAGQFVKPSVVVKNNYLKVDCKIDSGAVVVRWKETHKETNQVINTVKVDRVNYLTGWQWFFEYMGYIFMGFIVLFLAYKIIKRYTSLKLPF